ncbi:MAG: formamidopyrimidine-DNA glycosylase [bacterium]|nr:formamidopyrimidine-DNA glycosylase [bacterium]
MPELPDVMAYLSALAPRVMGQPVRQVRLISQFVLRSVDPPIDVVEGETVRDLRRLGKRIVLCLDDELFLVFHLMIAGRFRWHPTPPAKTSKITLASVMFPTGTLLLTEAGNKKRASLHVVRGEAGLALHQRGGLEVLEVDLDAFRQRLTSENHTLKRALTDPHLFSGIGQAYADEILHAAGLSPVKLTQRLTDDEIAGLYRAARATLSAWIDRLAEQFGERFPGPGDITAFRKDFAVHGRYDQPCPTCGHKVQRIRYAERETNYCPACQTGGRVLADRSLSRLLKDDWPRSIEELER